MTTTLSRIERVKLRATFVFRVEVRCDSGAEQWNETAVVAASAIASYRSFKRAMLKHAGLMFADNAFECRGGAERWASEVQWLLGAPAREGAA